MSRIYLYIIYCCIDSNLCINTFGQVYTNKDPFLTIGGHRPDDTLSLALIKHYPFVAELVDARTGEFILKPGPVKCFSVNITIGDSIVYREGNIEGAYFSRRLKEYFDMQTPCLLKLTLYNIQLNHRSNKQNVQARSLAYFIKP